MATGQLKTANLGGSGGETEFEQAFSSLAYAYLRDKAPRLLDSLIGFQLVDRNEDNTKAIGIFGFQLGNQWLYAPVFFLNGDLKGHELLYVKNNDSFVPLQENWVNYIMSRKPHILGEKSDKSTFELGGMSPNIRSLSQRPTHGGGKSASAAIPRLPAECMADVLPMLAACKTKQASFMYPGVVGRILDQSSVVNAPFSAAMAKVAADFDLNVVLPSNFELLGGAYAIAEAFPLVKKAMHQFYGQDCFSRWGRQLQHQKESDSTNIMKSAAVRQRLSPLLIDEPAKPRPVDHIKSGELKMYTHEQVMIEQPDELTDADREKLLHDTVLIKDDRDEKSLSTAYSVQVEAKLTNPSETDLYRVLVQPGQFDKMLLLISPATNAGKEDFTTAVRVGDSGNKAWLNTYADAVFADQVCDRTEWNKWFEGLSDSKSLEVGALYVGVGGKNDSIAPFKVVKKHEDGNYVVDFKTYADNTATRHRRRPSDCSVSPFSSLEPYISTYGAKLIIGAEGRDGTKLKAINGELRVPPSFKFMKLESPPKPRDDEDSCMPCCVSSDSGSEDIPIQLGRIEDIQMLFREKTAALRVHNNRTEVYIKSPIGDRRMSKRAALFELVGNHGLSEVAAREILRESEQKGDVRYRIAYADGYGHRKQAAPNTSTLDGGPNAPLYDDVDSSQGLEQVSPRKSAPAQYGQEAYYSIPELSGQRTDPSVWDIWQNYQKEDFQKSVSTAQQAGAAGQKEVFDTSMVSGMLKSVRQTSLVEKHLGPLVTALDALGRLLMNFYWHAEEFEDRYGKTDMPELEDSLRNSFDSLGDVTLFLKEKTIESPFDDSDISVEETARN